MSSALNKIFIYILPFYEVKKAEQTIEIKVADIIANGQRIIEYEKLPNVDKGLLEKIYNNTFDVKKTIEDKAKSGILGVTVAVGLISSVSSSYDNLSVIAICLYIIALLYSLIAGYLSLKVLGDKNTVYQLGFRDLLLNDEEHKEALLINSQLNIEQNVNRQNYVYSSYRHLVYSLLIMVIAFLSNLYFHDKSDNKNQKIYLDCNCSKEISRIEIIARQIDDMNNIKSPSKIKIDENKTRRTKKTPDKCISIEQINCNQIPIH